MKQKTLLVEIIIGLEHESIQFRDPRNGQVVYAGNKDGAIEFLASQVDNLKNESEVKND